MDTIPEVMIISSSICTVYDTNGAVLATYNERNIAPKTLTLIGEDYMLGAVTNQPKLKIWTISKVRREESTCFPCRGIVTALAVSSCGTYCIGGIKEDIHIWMISTGELLNVVSRHYQDITCLRFSSDDSHFISGGKDGHVIVWILSQVIAMHIERDQVKPRHVWNHHSSEVTDICPGSLGCVSRVATTSLDMTCKIYEMDSGILLSSVCLDVPLTAVVMDTLEYYVFLGANNGCIYKINTYDSLPREYHLNDVDKVQFKAHEQKIVSLSISLDGETLMSASEKMCRMWNIASMSCLKNFSIEGGITNAFLAIKPTALPSDPILPQFCIRPFKRDFEEAFRHGVMKFTQSKVLYDPLITTNEENPDKFFSRQLLLRSSKIAKEELSKPELKHYEDIFQQTLHGGTVNELKVVNNQLYSYLINHGLDNLPQESSD